MSLKCISIFTISILLSVSAWARSPIPTIELTKTTKTIESVTEMKSYYNGAARIFLHDNEEPAARPMEVTIVVPNGEEDNFVNLQTLSVDSFCSASLKNSKSTYNSKNGLTVKIPVSVYNVDTGDCSKNSTLNINVQMLYGSKSSVVAWMTAK
jgi:hypothetical protein